MRRGRTAVLIATALVMALSGPAEAAEQGTDCRAAETPVTAQNLALAERSLLCLVNVYRAANALEVLTGDSRLFTAARKHSAYMEQTNQFDHEGIGNGTPSERARAEGFPCDYDCVGENIARTGFPSSTPRDMFELWRGSPGHNANMLHDEYLTAGMGFAVGGNHGLTGTQNFAIEDGGATDTASDMLTSPACTEATAKHDAASRRVDRRKAKLRRADGRAEKRRARKKLKRARAKEKLAAATATSACDLAY